MRASNKTYTILGMKKLAFLFFILTFIVYLFTSAGQTPYDYFTRLADSFLQGKYYITQNPPWLSELIPAGLNKFYVVYPPMPAIIAIPFRLLFKEKFEQQYLAHLLGAGIAGLTILISWKIKKDIKIAEDTIIVRAPGNAVIKPVNINIGDSIIAIGTTETADILLGKRLIVSSTPIPTPLKVTSIGTVQSVTKSSLVISINSEEQKIFLTSKTIIKSPAGPIELADLDVGDTVIYTATVDDNESTATILMRIKTAPVE